MWNERGPRENWKISTFQTESWARNTMFNVSLCHWNQWQRRTKNHIHNNKIITDNEVKRRGKTFDSRSLLFFAQLLLQYFAHTTETFDFSSLYCVLLSPHPLLTEQRLLCMHRNFWICYFVKPSPILNKFSLLPLFSLRCQGLRSCLSIRTPQNTIRLWWLDEAHWLLRHIVHQHWTHTSKRSRWKWVRRIQCMNT